MSGVRYEMRSRILTAALVFSAASAFAESRSATRAPRGAVTPTPTICTQIPPPALHFQFSASPPTLIVGDHVQLSFTVSGSGGIPQYTLFGAAPIFEGDTSPMHSNVLGTVTYQLTAVQAGTASLTLNVNYETAFGCVESPIFQFVSETSPPFAVEVVTFTPTPTPTPPRLPAPTCTGDCDGDGSVDVGEIVTGVNLALGVLPRSICPTFNCPECHPGPIASGVDVTCLVRAVSNALSGCHPTHCAADEDCDDGNGCTFDRCADGQCVNDCVCVLP